jgi:hypothetical protein
LLDTVREQAKELDFLNQVVGFLVTEENLYKIKEKTDWDDERRKWKLAPFIIKQKEVSFPKLGMNAQNFVQEELGKDEIQFNDTKFSDVDAPYQNQGVNSSQRKTNGFKKESRNKQRGGMNGYKGQNASSSYINQIDKTNTHMSSQKSDLNKFTKIEQKQQDAIRLQQQRIMMQNDSYMMESPEMNNRRLNGKAGVQLAPIHAP